MFGEKKLYHYQIGFPKGIKTSFGTITPIYGSHAQLQANTKGFKLPASINTDTALVIEIEMNNGKVEKVLYRTKYDDTNDILLAVLVCNGYFCKTAWLNRKTDKHRTLDRSKYNKP